MDAVKYPDFVIPLERALEQLVCKWSETAGMLTFWATTEICQSLKS